jgi:hypothetical protein
VIREYENPKQLTSDDPNKPVVVFIHQAEIKCGCYVVLGKRTDTWEPCSAAVVCTPEHDAMIVDFNQRFRDSLKNPEDRSAIEVANEMLERVEMEYITNPDPRNRKDTQDD